MAQPAFFDAGVIAEYPIRIARRKLSFMLLLVSRLVYHEK
jgi:hypothetical protein